MGVRAGGLRVRSCGGAGEDGLSEAEPGDGTAAGHVVEAGPVLGSAEAAGKDAGDDRVRGAGELDGGSGAADLIVDDGEAIAFARQAKHGEKKVVAVRAVDPTGAEDEKFAADVFDGLLAGELAGAVDVERIGRVGLDPWRRFGLGFAAVENVVGGVVDEKGVAPEGFFGEDARRLLVDGVGKIALGLGAIDGGVGGGVENDIGRGAANQLAGLLGIGEIDGFAIDGDDGADAGKDFFELAAELAGVADDEECGDFWWIRVRGGVSLMRAGSGDRGSALLAF